MTTYDRAVRLAVRRLPAIDDDERDDIATTLEDLAVHEPAGRWRELASVLRLGARLRSRADTGDAPDAAWKQGLHRGGVLLLTACAVQAIGVARSGGLEATSVAAAVVVLVAATWAAVRGRPLVTSALAAPAVVLVAVEMATGDVRPFALRGVVALAALAVGAPPSRERRSLCPWRWAAALAAGAALALVGQGAAAVLALTLVVPLVWLLTSGADPRLAVGAAVALFWRLVAVDLHELADAAVELPTGRHLDVLLVRWAVMGAGLVGALAAARASIRRSQMI